MNGSFTINSHDTYAMWGIILAERSMDALLAYPGAKEYITNESRLENGTRVLTGASVLPRVASRELKLEVWLIAKDLSDYRAKYAAFLNELNSRVLNVQTPYTTDVYHLLYKSCNTFSDFNGRVAKMSLNVWEPNPANRT